jgi:hypothetical protein
MKELLIGTSAFAKADPFLIKAAGIGWIRQDFPFPFAERIGGTLADGYMKAKAEAQGWAAKGMRLMGVTPLHGVGGYKADVSGKYQFIWNDFLPAYMGGLNSEEFSRNYQELCAFLAADLIGIVQMWQISNELNIPMFAGPLSYYNGCELILHGAMGLKQSDPSLIVGPNSALPNMRYYFYGRLYADPRATYLDYVGIDGYYGTWDPGSPQSWDTALTELYDLTRVPMLVNEWGYSSAGGMMSVEHSQSSIPECQVKQWRHAWGEGHTPASQAAFVRDTMGIFHKHRKHLLGAFFYRWEDQEACWQCGSPDCPVETAWGLVDRQGQPKPSFFTHQEGVEKLLAA